MPGFDGTTQRLGPADVPARYSAQSTLAAYGRPEVGNQRKNPVTGVLISVDRRESDTIRNRKAEGLRLDRRMLVDLTQLEFAALPLSLIDFEAADL